MRAALAAVLLVAFGTTARGEGSERSAAPSYSAGGIVNWATGRAGPFAPNTVAILYGEELAYGEAAAAGAALRNRLPDRLARVQLLVMHGSAGTPVPLYYVGPRQINFLIPDSLQSTEAELRVLRDGVAGPPVRIPLDETAPAMLELPDGTVRASHATGEDITEANPARPGEIVVVWATGLGRAAARLEDGEIPAVPPHSLAALMLAAWKEFRVLIGGVPLDPGEIFYAGLTPGIAGLYQVNLRIPAGAAGNPEIRLAVGDRMSPEGLRLRVAPEGSGVAAPAP